MVCEACGYAGPAECARCGAPLAPEINTDTTLVTDAPGRAPAGREGVVSWLSRHNFDARRWTVSDKIVGVASLVVLISLFLPWYTATISAENSAGAVPRSASESGTDAHGWLRLVFVIVLLLVVYLVLTARFPALPFLSPLRHYLLMLALTAVDLLLIVIGFLLKPSADGIAGVSISWGIGAFLALIAAIVALMAPVPPRRKQLDSAVSAE
jgi:hypothetical protein